MSDVVWTPLPNGYKTGCIGNFEIRIGVDSGKLYIFNINQNRKCWMIDLPADIAICKATPSEEQPLWYKMGYDEQSVAQGDTE